MAVARLINVAYLPEEKKSVKSLRRIKQVAMNETCQNISVLMRQRACLVGLFFFPYIFCFCPCNFYYYLEYLTNSKQIIGFFLLSIGYKVGQ